MNETSDMKPSTLPANAVLLVVFIIVSGVLFAVFGPLGIFGLILVVVWSVKLLIDLVRWLRSDKDTRPAMRFPKKTALVLMMVILTVGYLLYLIARDLGTP